MEKQKTDKIKKEKKSEEKTAKQTKPRILVGNVVSDKQDKTVVVAVDKFKLNPKYHKKFKVTKRYQAHDEKNQYHQGDRIAIEESKPISKNKKWKVKTIS